MVARGSTDPCSAIGLGGNMSYYRKPPVA